MNFSRLLIPFVFAVTLINTAFINREERTVADFRLRNTEGNYTSLKDYPEAKGFIIVFICNHCPFAKLYPQRLNNLSAKYAQMNVPVIAINSTDSLVYEEESFSGMINTSRENKFTFPYLQDDLQVAAKDFNADKTPHAFVVWRENNKLVIKYNGAIDDNGAEPSKVKHAYIEDAVDALLKDKAVAIRETKSIGCAIKLRK